MDATYMEGVTVGLLIAAPIGPTSILCIERTLGNGIRAGLATGLAVASVHFVYAMLIVLTGLTLVKVGRDDALLGMASGAILMIFAVRAMTRAVVFERTPLKLSSLRSSYVSATMFASLNPLTPVLFAGFAPRLVQQGTESNMFVAIGVFAGSFLWWATLVIGVSWFRRQMNLQLLTVCNRLAGVLLAFMAVVAVMGALPHRAIASKPHVGDNTISTEPYSSAFVTKQARLN